MTASWKLGEETRGSRSGHGAVVGAVAAFVVTVPLLLIAEFALLTNGEATDAIGYFPGISLVAVPYLAIPALIIGAVGGAALGAIPDTPQGARFSPLWAALFGIPVAVILTVVLDLQAMIASTPIVCLTFWFAGRSFVKKTVVVSPDDRGMFRQIAVADPSRATSTTLQRSLWVGAMYSFIGTLAYNLTRMAIWWFTRISEGGSPPWLSGIEDSFDTSVQTSPYSVPIGAAAGVFLFATKRIDIAPIAAAASAGACLLWLMLNGRTTLDGVILAVITVSIYWLLGASFRRRVFKRAKPGDDGGPDVPPSTGPPPPGDVMPAGPPQAIAYQAASDSVATQLATPPSGGDRYAHSTPVETKQSEGFQWPSWWPLTLGLLVLVAIPVVFISRPFISADEEGLATAVNLSQTAEEVLLSASPDGGTPLAAVQPAHQDLCPEGPTRQISTGWSLDSSLGTSARASRILEALQDQGFDVESTSGFGKQPPFDPQYVFAAFRGETFVDARLTLLDDSDRLELHMFTGGCALFYKKELVASALAAD